MRAPRRVKALYRITLVEEVWHKGELQRTQQSSKSYKDEAAMRRELERHEQRLATSAARRAAVMQPDSNLWYARILADVVAYKAEVGPWEEM